MPSYRVSGMDDNGNHRSMVVEADSEEEALEQTRDQLWRSVVVAVDGRYAEVVARWGQEYQLLDRAAARSTGFRRLGMIIAVIGGSIAVLGALVGVLAIFGAGPPGFLVILWSLSIGVSLAVIGGMLYLLAEVLLANRQILIYLNQAMHDQRPSDQS